MRVTIDVKDKGEAAALRTAMEDPATRAFVLIVGTLLPLGPRARKRVLAFVADQVEEDAEQSVRIETHGQLPEDDPQKHHLTARIASVR